MKRKLIMILSLVLVIALSLSVLIACQKGLTTEQLDSLYKEFTKLHKNDAKESSTSFWVEGDVFVLEEGGKEISAKIKWTIEGTTLVKVGETSNAMGQYQVIVPDEVEEEVNYKLVGVMVDEDKKAYTDKNGQEYKLEISKVVPAGKAYNLAIKQLTNGTVIYALAQPATSSQYYVGSVGVAASAATFFTENVTGGQKIYTMVGSTKSYLGAKESNGHKNIVLGGIVNDTSSNYEGSVWTITDNEIKTNVNGTDWYLGTFGTNETFSVSDNKTYPAFLVEKGTAVQAQAVVAASEQNANSTISITSHTAVDGKVIVDVGTTVKFIVTPESNYEIVSVKNGSTVLTANDGVYSVVADKGVNILVETKEIGSNGAKSPVEGKIENKQIPIGWTYITNNSAYPNPDYYSNGGLKLNKVNMGILSPILDGATGNIAVTIKIGALNASKTPKTGNGHIFKVEALDAEGGVLLTEYIDTFTIDDKNQVVITTQGAVAQIRVTLNELPAKDGFAQNINLSGVTVAWGTDVVVDNNVAQIGTTKYETLAAAIEAAQAGDTIKLLKDITVTETIAITKTLTIDLNGKTLTNTTEIYNADNRNWSIISVREGGHLTIVDNGTDGAILAGAGFENFALDVRGETKNGATLVIKGGRIVGNDHGVYARIGEVTIEGGTFAVNAPDTDAIRFVLNLKDNEVNASIVVKGGKFEGYDPSQAASENPKANLVAEGYVSVASTVDGKTVYTVKEKSPVKKADINNLVADENHIYKLVVDIVQPEEKQVYATGAVASNRLTTEAEMTAASNIYVEQATGGYKLYFLDGQTKVYLGVTRTKSGTKYYNNLALNVETVWDITDTCIKTSVDRLADETGNAIEVYIGTFFNGGTNVNLTLSETKYITGDNAANVGVTQYVAYLAEVIAG